MRYLAAFALLVALGYGARQLNRRLLPDRPPVATLAEKYGWEMAIGDDTDPTPPHGIRRP